MSAFVPVPCWMFSMRMLCDLVGDAGGDGLGPFGLCLPDDVALGVLHPQDDGGLDVLAAIRQRGVGRSHLEGRHPVGQTAQSDGGVGVEGGGDAHTMGHVDDRCAPTSSAICA